VIIDQKCRSQLLIRNYSQIIRLIFADLLLKFAWWWRKRQNSTRIEHDDKVEYLRATVAGKRLDQLMPGDSNSQQQAGSNKKVSS
jgi:hypothetical protein